MNSNFFGKLFVFLIFFPLFYSCGNFEEIEIGEPKEVKIRGFEDNLLVFDIGLPVNNPTLYRISIKEMDVRVFLNDKYIGKLLIDEKISIKAKKDTVYYLPVKIRLANVLGTAFIMMNMKKGSQSEVRFEGQIKARALLITKTIDIKETKKINL